MAGRERQRKTRKVGRDGRAKAGKAVETENLGLTLGPIITYWPQDPGRYADPFPDSFSVCRIREVTFT